MQAQSTANLLQYLSPLRPAGPVFDKELRVASRRRRLYALRFAYAALLVLAILQAWYSVPRSGGGGSGVVQISRLGEMGKQIVGMVVWFQFITGQLLAAVLLSDAIGAEVRQRTLDVLLVTPVRSFQIVIGKLTSKLWQTVSLLAISLPMLAVVRVFGGVPWDFVLAGLCITLSAVIFAGALSLTSSLASRYPHQGVSAVGLWYLVIWGFVAMLLTSLSGFGYVNGTIVMPLLHLTNPFVALIDLTKAMLSGSGSTPASASWPWLCLILLASSAVLLAWSVQRVRRIVLRAVPLRGYEASDETKSHTGKSRRRGALRPVVGSPIAWKERCMPLFSMGRHGVFLIALLTVVVGVILVVSLLSGELVYFAFPLVQFLQLLFVIELAVGAARAIAKEREARTWPILLTTPLDDGEIIKGKAIGVFRRTLFLLVPLPVLYVLMFLLGPSTQQAPMYLVAWGGLVVLSLAGTALFLLGVGLYFSIRLKTTTAAVVATFAVYVAPKFLFCGFLSPLFAVSTGMLGAMTGQAGNAAMWGILVLGIAPCVVYAGLGMLFMRLAVRRVRRDVF